MNLNKVIALSAVLLGIMLASAQASTPNATTVALSEHAEDEEGFLTDADGRTLYLFLNDEAGSSSCTGDCAANWPPLLTEGTVIGLDGVAPGFLDTIEREDGALQVTYMDHALYYFAKDEQPGDVYGQAAGDAWYLVSLVGEPLENFTVQAAQSDEEAQPAALDVDPAVIQAGGQVFSQATCVTCHGSNGEGGVGVALAENGNLSNTSTVVMTILGGRGEMPAFGSRLSDEEIAAVATYIRNTWQNDFGAVTSEEVEQLR